MAQGNGKENIDPTIQWQNIQDAKNISTDSLEAEMMASAADLPQVIDTNSETSTSFLERSVGPALTIGTTSSLDSPCLTPPMREDGDSAKASPTGTLSNQPGLINRETEAYADDLARDLINATHDINEIRLSNQSAATTTSATIARMQPDEEEEEEDESQSQSQAGANEAEAAVEKKVEEAAKAATTTTTTTTQEDDKDDKRENEEKLALGAASAGIEIEENKAAHDHEEEQTQSSPSSSSSADKPKVFEEEEEEDKVDSKKVDIDIEELDWEADKEKEIIDQIQGKVGELTVKEEVVDEQEKKVDHASEVKVDEKVEKDEKSEEIGKEEIVVADSKEKEEISEASDVVNDQQIVEKKDAHSEAVIDTPEEKEIIEEEKVTKDELQKDKQDSEAIIDLVEEQQQRHQREEEEEKAQEEAKSEDYLITDSPEPDDTSNAPQEQSINLIDVHQETQHQSFQTAAATSLLVDCDKSEEEEDDEEEEEEEEEESKEEEEVEEPKMEFTKNYSDDLLMGGQSDSGNQQGETMPSSADLADFELPPYSGSSSGSEQAKQHSPVKRQSSSSNPSAAQPTSSHQNNVESSSPNLSAVKDLLMSSYSKVSHVLHWKRPIETGIIFGIGLTLITTLTFFSIISVFAYSALGLILASALIRTYKAATKALNRSSDLPFDHIWNKIQSLNVSLSLEKTHKLVDSSLNNLNASMLYFKQVLLFEDKIATVKCGLFLYMLTYIGAWFNGMTLITISYLALFSVPIFYEKNKTKIDEYFKLAFGQLSSTISLVTNKATSLAFGGSSSSSTGVTSSKKQN